MIPKQITFIKDNNEFLIDTVKEFCEPVISTLGPGGCTVIISNDNDSLPHVTKDGVTVAESIFFRDQRKQAIASLIKEAARKTANSVGDGTTTSIVLAEALILNGLKVLKTVTNKKEFFDGFDLAVEKITDYLTESSKSVTKDSALLESVVRISTNGDDKVCKIIMSAVKQAGADGLVNVELSSDPSTMVEVKNGASLESTAITPGGKRWEYDGVDIELVLVSGSLNNVYEIMPVLNSLYESKSAAIIIAKEFSEAVIQTVSTNNHRKSINVVLVEAEGYARVARSEILEDLAAVFNVPIYSTDGTTFDALSSYISRTCDNLSKSIITPSETVLFRDDDTLTEDAEVRYRALKKEYDELNSSIDQSAVLDQGGLKHLQRRMAKYNVVATIKVGASTKAEAIEMKDRIDDALSAITAAVNGGVIQGGGMALVRASIAASKIDVNTLTIDELKGYTLLSDSCMEPFRILALNTGTPAEFQMTNNLLIEENVYDFKDCKVVNWLEAGIIDPTLVPVFALTNASSVAKTILKSNSIITEWQDTMVE